MRSASQPNRIRHGNRNNFKLLLNSVHGFFFRRTRVPQTLHLKVFAKYPVRLETAPTGPGVPLN
ncbi:hypothetical protein F4054_02405 [Candidatus Poribacteria bacterium]|nr:hypothetical protein [Candidatus Poribacteria bacterium]MYK21095.1 hypothetical protein [Candidatus Poribacteria bacterium]